MAQRSEFTRGGDSFGEFMANLYRYGAAKQIYSMNNIVAHVARNEYILRALLGIYSFDFVFVDCLHTRAGVERDIRLVRPLVKPKGVIAFHDYGPIPGVPEGLFGVTEAVNGFVAREKARLEVVRTLAIVHLP